MPNVFEKMWNQLTHPRKKREVKIFSTHDSKEPLLAPEEDDEHHSNHTHHHTHAHKHHEQVHASSTFINIFPSSEHHHHHHAEDADETPIRTKKVSWIKRLLKQLRSVDGVDETAHLLGQILPGIGAPIATASILGLATPLVWLGVSGMREEYHGASEQLHDILASQKNTEDKLRALAGFSDQWRHYLTNKLGLEPITLAGITRTGDYSAEKLAQEIVKLQNLKDKALIAQIAKRWGWTGIVGMSGMFAGMFPATAAACAEIAEHAGAGASAGNAASILGMAAGGAFLAGQTAMTIYAANRARMGKHAVTILDDYIKKIPESSVKKHLTEILESQKQYIYKHSIRYGAMTVAGQAFMMTGTALGMTGVGAAIALPFLGVGAPLTIYPAIDRILVQERERGFKGKNTDYTKKILDNKNLANLLLDYADQENSLDLIANELTGTFGQTVEKLANIKLLSLLHHVRNDKSFMSHFLRKKTSTNSQDLLLALKGKIKEEASNSAIKKSQLENAIVQLIKVKIDENSGKLKQFFDLPSAAANQLLLHETTKVLRQSKNPSSYQLLRSVEAKKLPRNKVINELMKDFASDDHTTYKDDYTNLNEAEIIQLTRRLIKKGKEAHKHIRFELASSLVELAHMQALQPELQKEITKTAPHTNNAPKPAYQRQEGPLARACPQTASYIESSSGASSLNTEKHPIERNKPLVAPIPSPPLRTRLQSVSSSNNNTNRHRDIPTVKRTEPHTHRHSHTRPSETQYSRRRSPQENNDYPQPSSHHQYTYTGNSETYPSTRYQSKGHSRNLTPLIESRKYEGQGLRNNNGYLQEVALHHTRSSYNQAFNRVPRERYHSDSVVPGHKIEISYNKRPIYSAGSNPYGTPLTDMTSAYVTSRGSRQERYNQTERYPQKSSWREAYPPSGYSPLASSNEWQSRQGLHNNQYGHDLSYLR